MRISPAGVATRAPTPSSPRSATETARMSAASEKPKVSVRPGNPAMRPGSRASSALATQTVARSAPSRISALASAIASCDPKDSRCAVPTLVQTRTSGSAMPTSCRISPAWFMPSSTTATSAPCCRSSSDSGRPMWLFRLPRLRMVRNRVATTAAVASFVVVLPALPVMATTRAPERRRTPRATSCSARTVSSTTIASAGPRPRPAQTRRCSRRARPRPARGPRGGSA